MPPPTYRGKNSGGGALSRHTGIFSRNVSVARWSLRRHIGCLLLTKYMYMTIIMTMNIYITKDNVDYLETIKEKQSMSGLINKLLDGYRAVQKEPRGAVKKKSPSKIEALKQSVAQIKPLVALEDEECTGHETLRINCGRKGCKYA